MRWDEQAPSKLDGEEAQAERVHLGHPETLGPVEAGGRHDGVTRVVGPDHLAAGIEEAGRLEALPTPHIEHAPAPHALEHGAVAGLVEGQERVRRDALLGAFSRQPGLGAGGHKRSLVV